MNNKKISNNTFGEMTFNEDYWKVSERQNININGIIQSVKLEIDIIYIKYEKYRLGLMLEELRQYYSEHKEKLEIEKATQVLKKQEEIYQKLFIQEQGKLSHEIEEAALRKREEILEGQTEESFAKIVGKEKAKRCFVARTREEKLASLELKRMRIFKDCIEITCTCDWFKPSGGFSVFEDGSVEMLYVDSMSI